MSRSIPDKSRQFAIEVVSKLHGADFEAYWAGGCVRDQLLGRVPKDYDIATSAAPTEIRRLFGYQRTLPIGAAFGVITVLGPRGAGQVEVATFRQDATYSDGRRPDSVRFSTAREDASRRDFTINGLFYNPLTDEIVDFVDGRNDLERCVVRAIGDPALRFAEDKLRLLRAVRFAATFDFELEAQTLAAVRRMAAEITVVSAERIAAEMRRMLVAPQRTTAVRLLLETGLAEAILPEVVPRDPTERDRWTQTLALLKQLESPGFPLVLAALLHAWVDPTEATAVCRRWKLSNHETDRGTWLIAHRQTLVGASAKPWSAMQRIVISDGIEDLVALDEALARLGHRDPEEAAWCRAMLARPPEQLDPPPLLTGSDLIEHGIPTGPQYAVLLNRIRDAQLDGTIHTPAEALALADRLSIEGL